MMATGRSTEGSLAKSVTATCSQLLQTNSTEVFLLQLLKETTVQSWKKVFPVLHGAVLEGDMVKLLPAVDTGFNPVRTQMACQQCCWDLGKGIYIKLPLI